jgi:hypothetical protein
MSERLSAVLLAIDAANAADPKGTAVAYGQRMSAWVDRLRPDASEELRIAARGQHIRRWEIPRSDFPMHKTGYHQWRITLYGFHADRLAELMRAQGYDDASIERVRSIVQKKRLKTDPDAQTLEDAAALVFLEHDLAEFAARDDMDEPKLIDILRKTWAKMSAAGQQAALGLDLAPDLKPTVLKALRGA